MIFGYAPNDTRILIVGAGGIAAIRGRWPSAQATDANTDYWVDFSAVLAAAGGNVAVASISVAAASTLTGGTAPTIVESGTDGVYGCIVITGGTPGDRPTFSVSYTLTTGGTQTFTAVLPLQPLSQGVTPPQVAENLSAETPVEADVVTSLEDSDEILLIRAGQTLGAPFSLFRGQAGGVVLTGRPRASQTQTVGDILGRTVSIDDYQPHADGSDDVAAFNNAAADLAATGGVILISPARRYALLTQPTLPDGVSIECPIYPGGQNPAGRFDLCGGTLVLAPGSPINGARLLASWSGTTLSVTSSLAGTAAAGQQIVMAQLLTGSALPAGVTIAGSAPNFTLSQAVGSGTGVVLGAGPASGGKFWNPLRTTNSLILGNNGRVKGLIIVSARYTYATTAVQQEQYVYDPAVGMGNAGVAIQADNAWTVVEDCTIIGFNTGVLAVPKYIDGFGAETGNAGSGLQIRGRLRTDCVYPVRLHATAQQEEHDTVQQFPFTNAVPSSAQLGFGTPVSDGAGGCILPLSTYQGSAIVWTNGVAPGLGKPVVGGQITVSLYDNAGNPVASSSAAGTAGGANRQPGTWVANGSGGFNIQLPGILPNWFIYGALANGTDGITATAGTPTLAAFSAATYRGGAIEIMNTLATFRLIQSNGTPVSLLNVTHVGLNRVVIDSAVKDADVSVRYGIVAGGGSQTLDVNAYWFTGGFGGFDNSTSPGGGVQPSVSITNFYCVTAVVPINHRGNPMAVVGGHINNKTILSNSANPLVFVGTAGLDQATIITAPGFNPPYCDPSCPNLPVALQPALTAHTIGGNVLDQPGQASLSMTPQQILQSIGNVLPAPKIANNPALGTSGLFWTAADAGASAGTVNPAALMQAALTYTHVNNSICFNSAVQFPGGIYPLGTATFTLYGNEFLILDPGARITVARAAGSGATFTTNGFSSGARTGNLIFLAPGGNAGFDVVTDTWYDWRTNLRTTTPNFQSEFTVSGGVQGSSLILSWLTSASVLFVAGTNTMTFDALPPGYSTLAAVQAAIVGKYGNAPQYLAYGSICASVTGSGPYVVTYTPPAGATAAVLISSAGIVPAIPAAGETSSAAATATYKGQAQPTIDFLSAPPLFYNGHIFALCGDDILFDGIEIRNCVAGQGVLAVGNRLTMRDCKGYATDGNTGSTPFRFSGGNHMRSINCDWYSGDQAAQLSMGATWRGNAFNAVSDLGMRDCWFIGGRACSLSAQTLEAGLNVPNSLQATPWDTGASPNIAIGNTLTLPGPIPAGLTLSALQKSAAPWMSGQNYPTPGYNVVNNTKLYTLVSAGTSGLTGPTGTGSSISDGGCTWAYVSAGATLFVGTTQKAIAPGSCLYGVSGTSPYTLTLIPPLGATNAIVSAITTERNIQFIGGGTPLGAMQSSILGSGFRGLTVLAPSGYAAAFVNTDSSGCCDITLEDCVLDGTSCVDPPSASFGFVNVMGGSQGGTQFKMMNCRLIGYPTFAVGTSGNMLRLDISKNFIGQPSAPNATKSAISALGVLNGAIKDNIVFCSGVASGITIGGGDGADNLNQVLHNTSYNLAVSDNEIRAIGDAQFGISLLNSNSVDIVGNKMFPANASGSDNAGGILVGSTAVAGYADRNNYQAINGQASSFLGGSTLMIGSFERYNPTAANGLPNPTPTGSPTLSWSPTVTPTTLGDWTVTYQTQIGNYRLVNGILFVDFTITFTPTFTGAASGALKISLPATVAALTAPSLNIAHLDNAANTFVWPSGSTSADFNPQPGTNYGYVSFYKSAAASPFQLLAIAYIVSGTTYTIAGSGAIF